MAGEEKVKTEAEIKAAAEKKESDLALKLQHLETKVEGTEVLAQILADPDVRALLEAKQKGEKVKVVSAKQKEAVAKIAGFGDDVDFDALSNKQLADHMLKHFTTNIDAVFASKLEPITKVLKSLESYVGNTEAKTVAQRITEAKAKYSDFDTFVPDMQKLNKTSPDLSIEELYLISKRRKAGPADTKAESERPSTSPAKMPEKKKRDVPLPKGNAGFSILMSEALDALKLDVPD